MYPFSVHTPTPAINSISRPHNFSRILRHLPLIAAIALLIAPVLHAAPIYVLQRAITNNNITIAGFNNAGDLCGQYYTTNGTTSVYLLRDGVFHDVFPSGLTPAAVSAYPQFLSQRHADGSVQMVGFGYQADNYERGFSWLIGANGGYSVQALPNLINPPDNSAPGEQATGYANAVNSSGFIVGEGNSYIASVGLNWSQPYNVANTYIYGSATTAVAVNDQGVVLLNGVEFDHTTINDRYNAALFNGGLIEIPTPSTSLYPVHAIALTGTTVVGSAFFGTNQTPQPCVWSLGDALPTQLPAPPDMVPESGEADWVNASGDIVGQSYYRSSLGFGGQYQVLWKKSGGSYQVYILNTLIPSESPYAGAYTTTPDGIHINDQGQIALLNSFFGLQARIYQPVTNGLVQMTTTFFYGAKSDGQMIATVKLLRADGYNGAITVNYATSDGDAIAGRDYIAQSGTLTWGAGESGDQTITLPLVTNFLYAGDGKSFNLALSGPVNALLGDKSIASVNFYDAENVLLTNCPDSANPQYNVQAGSTNVVLTFVRSGSADGTMQITNLSLYDSTAVAGTDYVAVTNVAPITWTPGQTGPRSISIPLIPHPDLASPVSFYFIAQGAIDAATPLYLFGLVTITPPGQNPEFQVTTSSPLVPTNHLSLSAVVAQGLTILLQSSTNNVDWGTIAQVLSTNGVVQFNPVIHTNLPGQFFKLKVQ